MSDPTGQDQFKEVANRRAGYIKDRLGFLRRLLTVHPYATLASGEGRILLDELQRLEQLLKEQAPSPPKHYALYLTPGPNEVAMTLTPDGQLHIDMTRLLAFAQQHAPKQVTNE